MIAMASTKYHQIVCSVCGQRATRGHDPETGKPWAQCGCLPYPANCKHTSRGIVATPADPTPRELARIRGFRPIDDSVQADEREIADRLHGEPIAHPEPLVGLECNGRVIPYCIDCFLPSPLSHTPHCGERGRSDEGRMGNQMDRPTQSRSHRKGRNISG